ncbi:MAG TPA: helix-turn-helix domain-containing protein [Syntrophorhabdaceae bacterium]|jgi:excisionase family DNA binding protein|nr:helix-turn-helix domain-containing protein [Syntrophorhabdaceae bacterium]
MRFELEDHEIWEITQKIVEMLKPYLQISSKQEDAIYDKAGVAEYLHVDVSWINKQITLRAIPYIKMGKYTRFKKSDIDRWLEKKKVEPLQYVRVLKRG